MVQDGLISTETTLLDAGFETRLDTCWFSGPSFDVYGRANVFFFGRESKAHADKPNTPYDGDDVPGGTLDLVMETSTKLALQRDEAKRF